MQKKTTFRCKLQSVDLRKNDVKGCAEENVPTACEDCVFCTDTLKIVTLVT